MISLVASVNGWDQGVETYQVFQPLAAIDELYVKL